MSVDIKGKLASLLASVFSAPYELISSLIEIPPNKDFGDFAIPCFVFAQEKKDNPANIARKTAYCLKQHKNNGQVILTARSRGPYLNIFINKGYITKEIISYISMTEFKELHNRGRRKTVVIDYSSPNVAKPFGIGHLRSTVIGSSLKKIYSFLGYRVIGVNHLGDWGTQFGKLITAFKRWGSSEDLRKTDPVRYLYGLYVKYHSEAERNPKLEDEARSWFNKLENNEREARELWIMFRDLSIEEFKRIYKRLGVEFEYYTGESFYGDLLDETIETVKSAGITEMSEGALVVPFDGDEDLPPALLKKSDDSTLYLTRDIAAVLYRYDTFHFDLALYVVGSPQTLHFKQMFRVLQKMGKSWAAHCYHIPFGQIRFKDSTMSTRKGNIIFLEEVLDRAVALALEIIEEKNPGLQSKKKVAEAVGVSSIIFNDLKNNRIKDITFDWDEIINFNGETGVYLQYTHARANSLLKKFEEKYGGVVFRDDLPFSDEGYSIALLLNDFERVVNRAASEFEPSIIARYLLDLASRFNSFYNTHRVITQNFKVSMSRALIVSGVKKVLEQGLILLGIIAVDEM